MLAVLVAYSQRSRLPEWHEVAHDQNGRLAGTCCRLIYPCLGGVIGSGHKYCYPCHGVYQRAEHHAPASKNL